MRSHVILSMIKVAAAEADVPDLPPSGAPPRLLTQVTSTLIVFNVLFVTTLSTLWNHSAVVRTWTLWRKWWCYCCRFAPSSCLILKLLCYNSLGHSFESVLRTKTFPEIISWIWIKSHRKITDWLSAFFKKENEKQTKTSAQPQVDRLLIDPRFPAISAVNYCWDHSKFLRFDQNKNKKKTLHLWKKTNQFL